MQAERMRIADRQFDRSSILRRNLMGSAAWPRTLAIGMLSLGLGVPGVVGVSLVTAGGALAANECGPLAATVDCTGSFFPNQPAGNTNGGVEYEPSGAQNPFTLNFGDGTPGGSASVQAPLFNGTFLFSPFTVGQSGIFVGDSAQVNINAPIVGTVVNGLVVPVGGVATDVVVNVNEHSNVTGSAFGVFAWTTGDGNDAEVNNYGSITATGGGTVLAIPNAIPVVGGLTVGGPGTGINVVSDGGNATANNHNIIGAVSNGLNVYTGSGGTATANNYGSITSQTRDGIAIADHATGLLPSIGTAVALNDGTIDAGRHGINIISTGDATATMGATSVINAGMSTTGTGVSAISLTGNVVIDGDALSETNSASGPGIVGIALDGTSTVDAGVVNSGSGSASIGGFVIPAIPGMPSLSGGVLSLASGDAVANAHGDIMTTGSFGVLALSLNGSATATSAAGIAIDPLIGMAAVAFGAMPATVTNNAATVDGDLIGLLALNLGTGNAVVTSTGSIVTAPVAATAVAIGPSADAIVTNQGGGIFNGAVVLAAGQDALLTNTQNSQINIPSVSGIVMLAGRDATITNTGGSDINFAGPLSFNIMVAGNNATINNRNGSTFDMNGPISANVMVADHNATINNFNGADFNIDGVLTANVMLAHNDATINNFNGADFRLLGALNANVMVAHNNVTINNYNGGDFAVLGALNGNFMVGKNAYINNYNGGDFALLGGFNGNFMFADENAEIKNYNGGDFTLAGLANGNFMFAGHDALIDNYNGGTLNLLGVNGNLMAAGGDATINNYNGGTINLFGVNNLGFVAGGASTVNNSSVVNVAGFASFLGLDDFNNSVAQVGGGLLDMRNGISDYGLLTIPVYNSGIGDVTFVSGSFNGGYDSELGVDSYLGGVLDSSSDLLIAKRINQGMGPTFADGGPTAVLVNDTNPGPGAYNPIGIPVIGVLKGETQLGDFYLANGPINKGLFAYDLFLDSPGDQAAQWTPHFFDEADAWVLASYLDNYSVPQTMGIVQGMWHTLADSWIERASDLRTVYGSTGGAGADLSYEAPAVAVPAHHSGNSGIWGRVIGQVANRDVSYTTEPFPDQFVTVDGGYNEHLGAIQGGIDHAFGHGNGTTVIGLLAGYAHNNVDFVDAGDTAKITAPHIGAYVNWLNGGTYIDALVKADFLNVDFDVAGEEVSTKGHSLGARIEAGHRHQMGHAFIEPVASIAYVHTQLDPVTIGGTDVSYDDGKSLRGRVGGRLGFTSVNESGQFDPYVHAYVGSEFLGENTVFFDSGPGLTVVDDVSGIFGEVGGGFNFTGTDRRTALYGQANYIFSDGYHAGNAKVGARVNW